MIQHPPETALRVIVSQPLLGQEPILTFQLLFIIRFARFRARYIIGFPLHVGSEKPLVQSSPRFTLTRNLKWRLESGRFVPAVTAFDSLRHSIRVEAPSLS